MAKRDDAPCLSLEIRKERIESYLLWLNVEDDGLLSFARKKLAAFSLLVTFSSYILEYISI